MANLQGTSLFFVVKSLLEIGSIVFALYVTWTLGLHFLVVAMERFWPEHETSLLDKVFGLGYDSEGRLHCGRQGSPEDKACNIRFADRNEMLLFWYGLELRRQGFSRRQVKRVLKQAALVLRSREYAAVIENAVQA